MNTYWKASIALAAIIAAYLSGWYTNDIRYQKQIAEIQQQHTQEKLTLEQQATAVRAQLEKTIIDTAAQYQAYQTQATQETAKLKQELKNAQKKNPLPADCCLDTDRLRIIQQAVHAANHRTP